MTRLPRKEQLTLSIPLWGLRELGKLLSEITNLLNCQLQDFALIIYFTTWNFSYLLFWERFLSPPVLWDYVCVYIFKQLSGICTCNLLLVFGEGDCRAGAPPFFAKCRLRRDSASVCAHRPPSALLRLGLHLQLEEVTVPSQPQPSRA